MLKLLNSDKIIRLASQRYESLSESRQKYLRESLCNGRALLKNEDQMAAYLHHYGDMHKQKLLKAFHHLPSSLFNGDISVMDWGCGQGLGAIVLNDYIDKEKNISDGITDVTLIEPSLKCLRKAMANIEWSLPKTMLTALNKKEEEVLPEDICLQESRVVHIMSNIVDMPEFTGEGLKLCLKENRNCLHTLVMVSPFYPEDGRGKRMDMFIETLKGFRVIYSFQKHLDEWEEYYSCQIRILENSLK